MTDLTDVLDRVVCADALTFLASLPSASVDMVLTSPPYDNLRKYGGYTWDFEGIACELYRVIKLGGVVVWVVGDSVVDGSETLTSFEQAIYFKKHVGFKVWDTMIWEKGKGSSPNSGKNPTRYSPSFEYMFVLSKGAPDIANLLLEPNINAGMRKRGSQRQRNGLLQNYSGDYTVAQYSCMSNVWYLPVGWMHTTTDKDAFKHPAMFPEQLAERHILSWSNPNDVICDPFMGSGTTALMARNLGRHFLGCDLHEPYVKLAQDRLAKPWQPVLAGFA